MTLSRRRFLEDALLAAAAASVAARPLAAATFAPPARRAEDPLRIAVIGVRGRGRDHIASCKANPDAQVVAICDPDEAVIGPAARAVPDAKYVKDFRAVLDDPEVDAVSIATPNHWHALAAVWALQAGKHVFVEKPLSHDLREGRLLVNAARRYGKVVQHGTQARSHAACRDAIAWLQAGGLGAVKLATGLCYKPRASIGKVAGAQEPPASCDYDLWTGPAALGGRFGYDDDGETPNSQICFYDWGDKQVLFEVRGLATEARLGARIATLFHGEGGTLVIEDYARAVVLDAELKPAQIFEGGGDHFADFVTAARAGAAQGSAPAEEGHLSSALCHLGNVAWQLGDTRPLDAAAAPFGEHAAAQDAVARFRAHLAANGVAADAPMRVCEALSFDAAAESFTGARAAAANALNARPGRGAFAFPKDL
jgi:hypothetical protein